MQELGDARTPRSFRYSKDNAMAIAANSCRKRQAAHRIGGLTDIVNRGR
jgi:hypothetical protein